MTIRKKHTCFGCQVEFPADKLRKMNGIKICRSCWDRCGHLWWDDFGEQLESNINAIKYEICALQEMLDNTPEKYCIDRMSLEARLEKVRNELAEAEND